jgi:hypothetical protein
MLEAGGLEIEGEPLARPRREGGAVEVQADQVAGLVTVKAFLAKPSTTVYVDPKIGVA